MPGRTLNWFGFDELANFMRLSDFEIVNREWKQLIPRRLFGLGPIVNRTLGPLPGLRRLCLRQYVVARPINGSASCHKGDKALSASVLIPCRNEKGNIEAAVQRLPRFCEDLEIVFVEGHSRDGTWDEIERVKSKYSEYKIKALKQPGIGKKDAMRAAYDAASGDVLIILDADLTVPPEDIPKFYAAIAENKGEFINGTRLIYGMDKQAMRFLNYWANKIFAALFSYLLNQKFSDTLCGTKVLTRDSYNKILAGADFFGNLDPFGDFDLIFGASKANLRIIEVPVRYASREYGETQISRFSHGWLLLKMSAFAFWRIKML